MSVFENIQNIANKRGLSLQDVAIKSGLSKNVIYQYKNGAKSIKGLKRRAVNPSDETLMKIANTLNVPFSVLKIDFLNKMYMETGTPTSDKEVIQLLRSAQGRIYFRGSKAKTDKTGISINHIKKVPLVGTIAMGTPITADENIEGYISEYFANDIPSGVLFELKCKGNSMEPTIPDGALALIRQQPDVENGEIAAVLIDGEATLKRVHHDGNHVILVPDNKEYKPIILSKDHPGRVLGKLIRYTVDF